MTLIIVAIFLVCCILIATEKFTNVNKSAAAIFAGTVGWVLYICWGTDFVMHEHEGEYTDFLNGAVATSVAVKHYIAENIFLKYVGKAAEIVLFLLSTMTIVEILLNNGCFDFLTPWIRTRKSRKLLWMLSSCTFILSANLDNLTTASIMLVVMHALVPNRRQRFIYGSSVVIAANAGGALTVIGDPAGLWLWNSGAVTASNFSMSLLLPCLVAWGLPTYLLGRELPERIDIDWRPMPVGIGGLWFIPTFHNITKLSPFLGALCVLSVLWVVNEIFNRKLMNVDKMVERKMPRSLQYGVQQMILYVMGFMLAVGVVQETGAVHWLAEAIDAHVHNCWILGIVAGLISSVLDNFAASLSFFSLYPVAESAAGGYGEAFLQNGIYWKIIAYSTALAGNIVAIGSMSGVALLKMERMRITWYMAHVGWKAAAGWMAGLAVMALTLLVG